MADEPVEEELRGLPPAAIDRIRHQRASGVRGSLLTAAGAAAVRSVGLEPVGEVFGCVVLGLTWLAGSCGFGYGWNRTGGGWTSWSGGVPGTFGGGIAGGTSGGGGQGYRTGYRMAPSGWQPGAFGAGGGWRTPVVVSGDMAASRAAWAARPYAEAVGGAWRDAHDRMLAEARALGADGVLGIVRRATRVAGGGHEYASLGTAVRFVEPPRNRRVDQPRRTPWAATLTAEDCAAAASAGYLPAGVATGYSLALKHEDWQLRQQGSSWNNTEVDGLTELLSAARGDARGSLAANARRLSTTGELVVTENSLHTGERPCGEQKDIIAEALFVGTVLVPHPAPPARRGRALTVLPLTPPTAAARRRGR